eukprot:GHVH01002604.1.p1 GENE.GHVH01002604.1~~GHVH01002604.1.p1  ORF type:complete len:562 (+),score=79.05 GHVH01002604.1:99-1688(+)
MSDAIKSIKSPYGVKNVPNGFASKIFKVDTIKLADRHEQVVKGGRHLFEQLPKAFEGVKKISVIGFGPQGSAQAQNLRDSLQGTGIQTVVGLREGSATRVDAREVGFTEENGTLQNVKSAVSDADLVLALIADGAMAHEHERLLFRNMKGGATMGLSHGFLLSYMQSLGKAFPAGMDVIAVCPKGVGASVRRLYEQGKTCNGAGINSSFAVHQARDLDKATELSLGWSVALGSPFTFQTTLESEYKSDIFGERGTLCGGIHGLTECLNRWFQSQHGVGSEEAYVRSVEVITGPLTKILSKEGGFLGVVSYMKTNGCEEQFAKAFAAAYGPCYDVLSEIYDSVGSNEETRGVVDHGRRLLNYPMQSMANTSLWRTSEKVRSFKRENELVLKAIDPITAGMYCAMMIAQCDVLDINGHCYSEIANETIIEAVDSLNPYMAFKGIDYLVDNCSTTARLGARKWAPRFDYILTQQALPRIEAEDCGAISSPQYQHLLNHKIHNILAQCSLMRPSVEIAPVETSLERGAKTVSQ